MKKVRKVIKPRPYWHVDAKWVAGIILFFVLGAAFLTFNLSQTTTKQRSVEAITKTMALFFSPNGLDDETEISKINELLQAAPGKEFQPIQGIKLILREKDILNVPPREIRLSLFRPVAETLYEKGGEGLMIYAERPEAQQLLINAAGPFAAFTNKAHQRLNWAFMIFALISAVLILPMIYFSHHFGRLGSPGWVIFAVSLLGLMIFNGIGKMINGIDISVRPLPDSGMNAILGYLFGNVLPPLLQIITRNYTLFLCLGVVLILASCADEVIRRLKHKKTAK